MKPAFQSVLDLGLRDVGVSNQPRRLAARLGRFTPAIVALALVLAVIPCAVLRRTGAGDGAVLLFAAAWTATVLGMALRFTAGSPLAVIRVTADGRNQMRWLAHVPAVLLALLAALTGQLLLLPAAAVSVFLAVMVWRGSGRIPGLLRSVRERLEPGEAVLGDGLGTAMGVRRREALRLLVATNRRMLLASGSGVEEVPYESIRRFAIEWNALGRLGALTLEAGGIPVITAMNPPNLLSIAQALRAHGVEAADAELIAVAERGWEEALQRGRSGPSRRSLLRIAAAVLALLALAVTAAAAAGVDLRALRGAEKLPADGRSNLGGGAASLRYTPAPGLRELLTDEDFDAGPHDGARWELRSAPSAGYNAITLSHYIFDDPVLDSASAVRAFVAGKDAEHATLAGAPVTHTTRVVGGRTGYVWEHSTTNGSWYFTAWFPQPVHTVRLECIARSRQVEFERLCGEAVWTLRFTP
jgi:hypothetical protein